MSHNTRTEWSLDKVVLSVVLMVLALHAGLTIAYAIGARSARVAPGVSVEMGRELDWQLWDAENGFGYHRRVVPADPDHFYVVQLGRVSAPLCWLCGDYRAESTVLSAPIYRQGDWLYQRYTWVGQPVALNLVTGEVLLSERLTDRDDSAAREESLPPTPADEPVYARMGFTFDPALQLRWDALEKQPLSTLNDSCFVLHMAFGVLYLLTAFTALAAWLGKRLRAVRP
jgi:hypothetical protein